MPVILTMPEEIEMWMTAPTEEALSASFLEAVGRHPVVNLTQYEHCGIDHCFA
jgi:hypothetical protein